MQPMAVDQAGTSREMSFPPKYGEHTRSIMQEAGYDESDVDKLAQSGIVSD